MSNLPNHAYEPFLSRFGVIPAEFIYQTDYPGTSRAEAISIPQLMLFTCHHKHRIWILLLRLSLLLDSHFTTHIIAVSCGSASLARYTSLIYFQLSSIHRNHKNYYIWSDILWSRGLIFCFHFATRDHETVAVSAIGDDWYATRQRMRGSVGVEDKRFA